MSDPSEVSQGEYDAQHDAPEEDQGARVTVAEPVRPQLACHACRRPIESAYYTCRGSVVCPVCLPVVEAKLTGGSRLVRFLLASSAGLVAAGLGAGIYYAIAALTGYEIGLVAIVVGLMVGGAVRWGSDARGGWFYQTMAIFLTYSAIVVTYLPIIIKGLGEMDAGGKPALAGDKGSQGAPTTTRSPTSAEAMAEAGIAPVTTGAASRPSEATTRQIAAVAAEDEPPDFDEMSPAERIVALFLFVLLLLVVAYVAPFLAGSESIIGLFIIGFAVYEAWRLNKRGDLEISGPHDVNDEGIGELQQHTVAAGEGTGGQGSGSDSAG
ncbi:MAG: hypothetical protein JXQ73_08765 [Phycisphaerae bacterium]|nr:hypothetical protein [Phycisphaerae bacterium]